MLRCCEFLLREEKKKIEILCGGRQRRSLLPSAAASPSYAAGERLVSAEWRGWSGEEALLQTAVSLTDNEWPGSIWKQQPWTNMMYTSSLANGCHQFCLHHGDRRRRRRLRQRAARKRHQFVLILSLTEANASSIENTVR